VAPHAFAKGPERFPVELFEALGEGGTVGESDLAGDLLQRTA